MAIVFTTGSTDGLGRAAAQSLPNDDHQVVLHTRSAERAAELGELASRAAGVVIGDLRSAGRIRSIADQVNAIGRMDAIIHNAVAYTEGSRGSTREGHAGVIAVNTLAPYMLTALIARHARLVYLSNTSSISRRPPLEKRRPAGPYARRRARGHAGRRGPASSRAPRIRGWCRLPAARIWPSAAYDIWVSACLVLDCACQTRENSHDRRVR
jgi:NAD(P)-dependent dehydrogenase (short-subunit alcohol dehydrogenase family)